MIFAHMTHMLYWAFMAYELYHIIHKTDVFAEGNFDARTNQNLTTILPLYFSHLNLILILNM